VDEIIGLRIQGQHKKRGGPLSPSLATLLYYPSGTEYVQSPDPGVRLREATGAALWVLGLLQFDDCQAINAHFIHIEAH
jgi:hypothetical protein